MKLFITLRQIFFISLICFSINCHAKGTILILGDSLSAGYGLQKHEAWPSLLQNKLYAENLDYIVINASVSGATSSDGLNALPKLLKTYHPDILILALGSNDGLRRRSPMQIQNTLAEIIVRAQSNDAKVLLIGFKIPLSFGPKYTTAFANIFPELSKEFNLPFVPFLLSGFELDLNYFQEDRLHPTSAAQSIMLQNVWPHLQTMLLEKAT